MISYFGWAYTLILTVLTIFGSLAVGYSVGTLVKDKGSFQAKNERMTKKNALLFIVINYIMVLGS
jgi:hypothetical protein